MSNYFAALKLMTLWLLLTYRRYNILDRKVQFRRRRKTRLSMFSPWASGSVTVCIRNEPPRLCIPFCLYFPTSHPNLRRNPWRQPVTLRGPFIAKKTNVISQKSSFPKGRYSPQETRQNKKSPYSRWMRGEAYRLFRLPGEDLFSLHSYFKRSYTNRFFF